MVGTLVAIVEPGNCPKFPGYSCVYSASMERADAEIELETVVVAAATENPVTVTHFTMEVVVGSAAALVASLCCPFANSVWPAELILQ